MQIEVNPPDDDNAWLAPALFRVVLPGGCRLHVYGTDSPGVGNEKATYWVDRGVREAVDHLVDRGAVRGVPRHLVEEAVEMLLSAYAVCGKAAHAR